MQNTDALESGRMCDWCSAGSEGMPVFMGALWKCKHSRSHCMQHMSAPAAAQHVRSGMRKSCKQSHTGRNARDECSSSSSSTSVKGGMLHNNHSRGGWVVGTNRLKG
jgi:hypothetical protein